MRVALLSMIIIAIVVGVGVKTAFPDYGTVAENRVRNVLNGMQDGTNASSIKVETAMAMWAFNLIRVTDRDRLSWASDNFDRWRQERALYRKIGSYTIDSVELVPDAPEETAIVTFTLEGEVYKVRVPRDRAISWIGEK